MAAPPRGDLCPPSERGRHQGPREFGSRPRRLGAGPSPKLAWDGRRCDLAATAATLVPAHGSQKRRDPGPPSERLLEASRAYERLVEVHYISGENLPSLYASLRALNLAEAAGPSPELIPRLGHRWRDFRICAPAKTDIALSGASTASF